MIAAQTVIWTANWTKSEALGLLWWKSMVRPMAEKSRPTVTYDGNVIKNVPTPQIFMSNTPPQLKSCADTRKARTTEKKTSTVPVQVNFMTD